MTRFEKFKSVKRIEKELDLFRHTAEQADIEPEKKQRLFAILDRAIYEARRGRTKLIRAIVEGMESAIEKFNSKSSSLNNV